MIFKYAVILIIVLLFFGRGKIPSLLGDLGKGMKSFKDGLNGTDDKKEIEKKD
jgi:sec-independent protein translocase protein TatA